jgi:hypothetical protein
MVAIASTWFACIVCGHLFGANVGWTLFVLIELRASSAFILGRWKERAADQTQITSCAIVRIDIR